MVGDIISRHKPCELEHEVQYKPPTLEKRIQTCQGKDIVTYSELKWIY